MVFSVGNIIRNILKNGIDTSYFLLGNDYFMQKMFIQKIKEYLNNQVNTEYFYFNDEKQKSKEFFNQILNTENANPDIIKETQKRLNRDLSE